MKFGVIGTAIGLLLLGDGVFSMGDRSGLTNQRLYVAGLTLLMVGIVRLAYVGRQSRGWSLLFAAPAAGVLTWTLYELIRQGLPMPTIGVLAEMTAPVLSTISTLTLVVAWLAVRRSTSTTTDLPSST
jgi:membrane protease YdiL (CAAX protease family)